LIITTGGTGFSDRDVTPEATLSVLEREFSSISLEICIETCRVEPLSVLSRGVSGAIGGTLVLNVPGSPSAVRQHLEVGLPMLAHASAALREESSFSKKDLC
jgi:molybdopterin adenylyltransferase